MFVVNEVNTVQRRYLSPTVVAAATAAMEKQKITMHMHESRWIDEGEKTLRTEKDRHAATGWKPYMSAASMHTTKQKVKRKLKFSGFYFHSPSPHLFHVYF